MLYTVIVMKIANPGYIINHHASGYSLPRFKSEPQVTASAGTPIFKNDAIVLGLLLLLLAIIFYTSNLSSFQNFYKSKYFLTSNN